MESIKKQNTKKTTLKILYELEKEYQKKIEIGQLLLNDYVEPRTAQYELISAKIDELWCALRIINTEIKVNKKNDN